MAIGYGAQVVEKHFILSREEKGIDYESSLNPDDFIEFVDCVRNAEKAIGKKNTREFTEGENNYRVYCKKAIVACCDIQKGQVITRNKIYFVRSEPGIPPDKFHEIDGKIAKSDIKMYNNITDRDL